MITRAAYTTVGLAALVVLIDQGIKQYSLAQSMTAGGDLIGVQLTFNNGVWGEVPSFILALIFIVLIVTLAGIWKKRPQMWMIGVLAVGLMGNFVDRLHYGQVIDYIVFYRTAFNMSDLVVIVGAFGAVMQLNKVR